LSFVMSDPPKPILKRSATEPSNRSHGVHFPPSPATCTYSAYSSAAYDRSPIVVTPNSCALPERGGRTYTLEEQQQHPRRGISFASDFHPRALAFASSRPAPLPQLIPDVSSESDESDGWSAAVPTTSTTFGIHGLASKCNFGDANMDAYTNCVEAALAFLPYPPSPPSSQKYPYPESIDPFPQSYRRRRGEREIKHESSSDPDRIPSRVVGDNNNVHSAFASLSLSSTPTKRSIKKKAPKVPTHHHLLLPPLSHVCRFW